MVQQWWNEIVRWFNSSAGQSVLTNVIIPVLAILAAGIIATLIARGSVKRLIGQQEREQKASAIASLIAAGRKAATWNTLSAVEKDHIDHQLSESEVRVRLLPVAGSTLAADWAAHHLATMKTNSVNYSFQAEQDLADFQDGLIAWHAKPSRARKLFAQDLAAWKYEAAPAEDPIAVKQREWASAQPTSAMPTSPMADQTTAIPQPASN